MRSLAAANPAIVRALMDHLVRAFEEFASQKANESERGLEYVDALMGCHNFYKAVLLDLERRIAEDGSPDYRNILRRTAVDTLIQALGLEGYYRR